MVRTWGYGLAGEESVEAGKNAFAVFQFFRHTLAIVVEGDDEACRDGIIPLVAVRAMHDTAKGLEGEDAEQVLRQSLTAAVGQVRAFAKKHDIVPRGLSIAATWIAAEQAWIAQIGPASVYHLRGQRGRTLGVDAGAVDLRDAGMPKVHIRGPIALEGADVVVLAAGAAPGRISKRKLTAEDWSLPQRAVRRVLEGLAGVVPETCVLVGVAMNKSPEFIRPTHPPNLKLLDQEVYAIQGRVDAREAVARERADEVNPEWGKARFDPEVQVVEREQLEFKELEKRQEEEEEEFTFFERFFMGFLIIRDKVFESFRSSKGERQAKMGSAAVAMVFVLFLVAGLFFQGQLTPPPPVEEDVAEVPFDDGTFEVKNTPMSGGKRSREARSGARAGGDIKPVVNTSASTGGDVAAEGGLSMYQRGGIFVAFVAAILGALTYRRKMTERATKALEDARRAQLRSKLSQALAGTARNPLGQTCIGVDAEAAMATLGAVHGAEEVLLLLATSVARGESAEEEALARPATRVVEPDAIIGVEIEQEIAIKMNSKGGKHQQMVSSVEVVLRLADPTKPMHRVRLLDGTPQPVGTDEHAEALRKAWHWEGVVRAMLHRHHRPSTATTLEQLRRLRDQGKVTLHEFELVRVGLSSRRSRRFA